ANVKQAGGGSGIRYFDVKVAIDDADDRLRPGMTSQVAIITNTAGSALTVPIQSVVERVPGKKAADEIDDTMTKKKYVFVVADGKVKLREVTTGISNATHVAIMSGLTGDEMIVTGPFRILKKLNDGDSVEITKAVTTTDEKEK